LEAHKITKGFHNQLFAYDGTDKSRNGITESILKINSSVIQSIAKYHLFFCLDESGSMSGSPWNDLMAAVNAFIQKRIELCQNSGYPIEDLVTVVNYSGNGRVVLTNEIITSNPQRKINFNSGGTNFAEGLKTVIQCLNGANLAGYTPCLLFMSDGGCSNGEAEMKLIRNQNPNMKIFVIGFSSGCDRGKMNNMAQCGGGQFFFGADGSQLKSEFETISIKISGGVLAL